MVTDTLSNLVTQIRNGYSANLQVVNVPWSRLSQALADVLKTEGFVGDVLRQENKLSVNLKYTGKSPALTGIKRVSKPGVRIYRPIKRLPRVLGGLGINILSTPKGVMSDKQAKKLHVGGEILCQVW